MLREPQHERKILDDIKNPPFVPSSSSGRALSTVEGLRLSFQQPASESEAMQSRFRVVMTPLTLGWCLCLGCVEISAQDDLVAKAQNERELILNGTALVGQFEKFSEPFKRRHPFIKVQYARTTGGALTTKILREAAARQLSVDVILINNYTHRIFIKKNLLTQYAQ